MSLQITADQARWLRLARQGLREPFADPVEAATAVVGVQAQIHPAAALALWNRSGAAAAAVDRLLYNERALVKIWGQRGTLHLYASADWPLIYGAHSDLPTYWERKAARNGEPLDEHEALVAHVAALLRERESLGRSDLRALRDAGLALDDNHLSGWGGIFAVLVRRGMACLVAREGEARLAHRERWLPALAWTPLDSEVAHVELARRYVRGYGLATVRDLAYWRGRSVAEARRWLAALAPELAEIRVDGALALVARADLEALAVKPPDLDGWPVRLLGRFDLLLLSTKEKDWLIDQRDYGRVWRPAGHIEATLLVAGRIAGVWRYDWQRGGLRLTVRPFAPPAAFVRAAVEQEAPRLAAHFGVPLAELTWEEA